MKFKGILAVCVVLILIFGLDLWSYTSNIENVPRDSLTYIEAAKMLYNDLMVHPYRPAGFALLSGLPFLFFNEPSILSLISFGVFINFIFWVATCVTLYRSLGLIIDTKRAKLGTLFLILSVSPVVYSFFLLTESLSALLILIVANQVLKFHLYKISKHAFIAASFMILSVLIKPGVLYLAIFCLILLIGFTVYEKIRFSHYCWLVVISICFVVAQVIAMNNSFEKHTVSFIDKTTWYMYLGAEAEASKKNVSLEEIRAQRDAKLKPLSWSQKSNLAKRDLVDQFKHNYGFVLSNYFDNLIWNTISGNGILKRIAKQKTSRFHSLLYYLLFIVSAVQCLVYVGASMFAIGWILLKKKLLNVFIVNASAIIIYLVMTSGISFWQGDRFFVVFYPVTILLVSYVLKIEYGERKRII